MYKELCYTEFSVIEIHILNSKPFCLLQNEINLLLYECCLKECLLLTVYYGKMVKVTNHLR